MSVAWRCFVSLPDSRVQGRQRSVAGSSSFHKVADKLLRDDQEDVKSILIELYEKSLVAHEAEKQKLEAEKQALARGLELQLQASRYQLQDVRTELAALKNMLNARGMIELVEEEFEKVDPGLRTKPRALKWQEALDIPQFSSLRQCLLEIRALKLHSSEQAGKAVASLYQELSLRAGHGHPTTEEWQCSSRVLDIDAAGLAPARGRLVACLASFLSIKHIFNKALNGGIE